ncbi:cytochrome P450 [Oceanobacillus jeddahense]|uniref:Cytochrome P450 n=1 Tax=Oceanobacillus jeddahense TaxID=1462527 RepID=A0ABY5JTF3_9BACI|nr:cytochrome P450 [Oceanobacillus jeddahense]UUI02742.1 cytochrome P450 [Oceanobacillus jeddahense]
MVKPIVQDKGMDHTIDFLREGYFYFSKRMNAYHEDVVQSRIFGRKLIMTRGKEALELVKNNTMLEPEKSIAELSPNLLTEENGICYLADIDYYYEKEWFPQVLTAEQRKELESIIRQRWEERIEAWKINPSIHFVAEMEEMWVIAVCNWLGIPIRANNLQQRTTDIQEFVQLFSKYGLNRWKRHQAKNRIEKWLIFLVRQLRAGRIHIDEEKILYKLSWYEDKSGHILSNKEVVHELLTLIRSFVASSRWVVFSQLALIENPELKERLQDDQEYVHCFIHEVIRYYSIIPFAAAKTQQQFFWRDMFFPKNQLVLFDIRGTNYHPDVWSEPEVFRPDRFLGKLSHIGTELSNESDSDKDSVTVQLMKLSLSYLLRTDWVVPDQALTCHGSEVPAKPQNDIRLEFYHEDFVKDI